MLDRALNIARRWADADETINAAEIHDALSAIRDAGKQLALLDSSTAHAVIEFYSDNAAVAYGARTLDIFLNHADPLIERYTRERLILTFFEGDAAYPLIERIREHGLKLDEDVMAFIFVLWCVLANEQGAPIAQKISEYLREHALSTEVIEAISGELRREGLDPSRIFGSA
jgi:hypothetical protein